jgi:hypothetical protein
MSLATHVNERHYLSNTDIPSTHCASMAQAAFFSHCASCLSWQLKNTIATCQNKTRNAKSFTDPSATEQISLSAGLPGAWVGRLGFCFAHKTNNYSRPCCLPDLLPLSGESGNSEVAMYWHWLRPRQPQTNPRSCPETGSNNFNCTLPCFCA